MKLKPCPFCGLPAKMHTAYYISEYAAADDSIPKDAIVIREWRKPGAKKWTVEFRRCAYVPQCTDPACVGRSHKKYQTEGEAIAAWNRRTNGKDGEPGVKCIDCQSDCQMIGLDMPACSAYEPPKEE